MSGDEAPRALYLALLLILVGSSLVGMRLPMAKAAKMLLAWVAIFATAFILFAFRDDFSALGERLKSEATGEPVAAGSALRIPMASDGHFWVSGTINGERVRFLVDSGATMTTIDRSTALRTGVDVDPAQDQLVRTGNGTIRVSRGRAGQLAIGDIRRSDIALHVVDTSELNVLGMNFLSSLDRWGVEGRWLVLVP